MKKMFLIAVALVAVLYTASLYADDGSAAAQSGEKTLFQIISDDINKPYVVKDKDKVIPVKEIHTFQAMADGIKEGSEKAKKESLRTAK